MSKGMDKQKKAAKKEPTKSLKEKRAEKKASKREEKAEAQRKGNELRLFATIEPEGVNRVTGDSEWEYVDLAVDSGATETVLSLSLIHI